MKKIAHTMPALLLLAALSACSLVPSFNGSRIGNDSQLLMEYSLFNSTYSQQLTLEAGDMLLGETVCEAGKLSVTLEKEGAHPPVFQQENIPTGTVRIDIEEDGEYTLTVTGENARGSLYFAKAGAKP